LRFLIDALKVFILQTKLKHSFNKKSGNEYSRFFINDIFQEKLRSQKVVSDKVVFKN